VSIEAGPHQGQPVETAGTPLNDSHAALILVHGRGATAASILGLVSEIAEPGFACLAPQAAMNTWYPNSFLAPIPSNEPYLSSALAVLASLLERVRGASIPAERTLLLGFSQGACLASEFVARNADRYGGLAALSGGLIGPTGTPREYPGSLAGMPVFLGCSDVDAHVPKERVMESAAVFERMGATVDLRLYRGMGHTINQDEVDAVRAMLRRVRSEE
jgi:predicted esterase